MKTNKNLSRNDRKRTAYSNATRTQNQGFKPLNFADPHFTYKDIARCAVVDITTIADKCGLSSDLLLNILHLHPFPKSLCAGVVDAFPIRDYEATIEIDVVIIANESGDTFPLINFNHAGNLAIFNGYKWYLENKHSFLKQLSHYKKTNNLLLIPVGGV